MLIIIPNIFNIFFYFNFYQNPKETALSIGKQAPIPNQTANTNPTTKTRLAIGRRNGFWNLLTFSINGTVINPAGTEAIAKTPKFDLDADAIAHHKSISETHHKILMN